MSLLIKLNVVEPGKKTMYLRAHLIMSVEPHNDNQLLSVVATSIMTNKGPIVFQCLDSLESIATAVNNALMAVPDSRAS